MLVPHRQRQSLQDTYRELLTSLPSSPAVPSFRVHRQQHAWIWWKLCPYFVYIEAGCHPKAEHQYSLCVDSNSKGICEWALYVTFSWRDIHRRDWLPHCTDHSIQGSFRPVSALQICFMIYQFIHLSYIPFPRQYFQLSLNFFTARTVSSSRDHLVLFLRFSFSSCFVWIFVHSRAYLCHGVLSPEGLMISLHDAR